LKVQSSNFVTFSQRHSIQSSEEFRNDADDRLL